MNKQTEKIFQYTLVAVSIALAIFLSIDSPLRPGSFSKSSKSAVIRSSKSGLFSIVVPKGWAWREQKEKLSSSAYIIEGGDKSHFIGISWYRFHPKLSPDAQMAEMEKTARYFLSRFKHDVDQNADLKRIKIDGAETWQIHYGESTGLGPGMIFISHKGYNFIIDFTYRDANQKKAMNEIVSSMKLNRTFPVTLSIPKEQAEVAAAFFKREVIKKDRQSGGVSINLTGEVKPAANK